MIESNIIYKTNSTDTTNLPYIILLEYNQLVIYNTFGTPTWISCIRNISKNNLNLEIGYIILHNDSNLIMYNNYDNSVLWSLY